MGSPRHAPIVAKVLKHTCERLGDNNEIDPAVAMGILASGSFKGDNYCFKTVEPRSRLEVSLGVIEISKNDKRKLCPLSPQAPSVPNCVELSTAMITSHNKDVDALEGNLACCGVGKSVLSEISAVVVNAPIG